MSIAEIIHAVDEPLDSTQCGGKESCRDGEKCLTHDLWANLNQHIVEYLGAITLKQVVDKQKAKQISVVQVQDMRGTLTKRQPTSVSF